MSSQGPNNCSTGTGTTWVNPSNVTVSGSSYATYPVNRPNVVTTSYVNGTVFGFSIPAGATIKGLVASFSRRQSLNNGSVLNTDNVVLGSASKFGVGTWTNVPVTETYGSPTDLWGTTWTPAQINASSFGLSVQVDIDTSGSSGNILAEVNDFLVTVYYTVGGSKAVCSQVIAF